MANRVVTDFGRYEALKARLGTIKEGLGSPAGKKFITKVKVILTEDNRDGLLRGLDKDGVPMAPLKPSTLQARTGAGPPLSPHETMSRVIRDFRAVEYRYGGQVIVRGEWTGDVPIWLGYHRTGTRNMARRNIVGIRPAGRQRIKDAHKQYQKDLINGRG